MDRSSAQFSNDRLGVFVEDTNQHAAGPRERVIDRLANATLALGAALENDMLLEALISHAKADAERVLT